LKLIILRIWQVTTIIASILGDYSALPTAGR
jgi:hypothetical protein